MKTITVYRFCVYDVRGEELVTSKRWGTRDAITRIGGRVIEDGCVQADPTAIDCPMLDDAVAVRAPMMTAPYNASREREG